MAGYSIYYCDDEQIFIDRFRQRHPHYDVTAFNSSDGLLEKLKDTEQLPDLILLDLYFPKDDTREGYAEDVQQAQAALDNLSKGLDAVKATVEKVRTPHGVEVLEHLHSDKQPQRIQDIPVALYTRRGLLILDDKFIRAVADKGGRWIIKNSKSGAEQISKETEMIWIESVIKNAKKSGHVLSSDDFKKMTPGQFFRSLTWGTITILVAIMLGAYSFGVWTANFLD